jgi:hypothetical protein
MQQPFGAADASTVERGTVFAPAVAEREVLLDLRAVFRGALVFRVFFDAAFDAAFEAFVGFFIASPQSIPFDEGAGALRDNKTICAMAVICTWVNFT